MRNATGRAQGPARVHYRVPPSPTRLLRARLGRRALVEAVGAEWATSGKRFFKKEALG